MILYELEAGSQEHRKEFITINNMKDKLPDLFTDQPDVPKLRRFIEDNLGFHVMHETGVVAYLAMYGLKPEPALPEPEVIPEPEIDYEFDALVAKAQAVWRGVSNRSEIAKDRKNLVLRFWKTAENCRAKISVRKVKVVRTKKTTTREIEEVNQIEVSLKDGQQQNVKENKHQAVANEKVTEQKFFQDAYKVEVEDAQTFDDQGHMVKFSTLNEPKQENRTIFQENMPPRSIALEWFRMGVYVWWKQQPQGEAVRLEKVQLNSKGLYEFSIVNRNLNTYKVEGPELSPRKR